jgi:hypothetical protein
MKKNIYLIHPFGLIALDSLAANALYTFLLICGICADAGGDGKRYHLARHGTRKGKKVFWADIRWAFWCGIF